MVVIDRSEVGPIGFGLMNFTWNDNPAPIPDIVKVMKAAVDHGALLWNGGEFYGSPEFNSLHLIRAYFDRYPEDRNRIRFSIKGSLNRKTFTPALDESEIRESIRFCQSILGDIPLDIYEVARFDPDRPVEEVLNVLAKVHKQGLVRGISLSEASADTIEKAYKILGNALKTVEVELSIFTPDPLQNGVAAACKKYGLPMTAYSPLGRGFLAGKFAKEEDLLPFMRTIPRFQGENFKTNLRMVDELKAIAESKGMATSDIALGWVLSQSNKDGNPEIIPIPGASSVSRAKQNFSVKPLTDQDLAKIGDLMKQLPVVGARYDEVSSKYTTV